MSITLVTFLFRKYNNACALCGAHGKGVRLDIHHIDGNGCMSETKNNDVPNLTLLCASCHSKADHARRRSLRLLSAQLA
ncbi:MAG: HNH endonuclease [Chloroflexi bacterium]|nr:HNH endonuclease [Chloroflexota bacterium]